MRSSFTSSMAGLLASLLVMNTGLAFLLPQQSPAARLSMSLQAHRQSEGAVSRSELLQGLALAAAPLLLRPQGARADEGTQTYKDNKYLVSFSNIPSSWQRTDTRVGADEKDFRRLVVYKDPNSEANAFVAYTDVRPDFATLGSFGSIRDVAKTIIPTGKDLESSVVRMESTKGYYLYEYVIKPPRQPKRHLQTIFALIPGQVLVTYTTSCLEDTFEGLAPTLNAITDSFKIETPAD